MNKTTFQRCYGWSSPLHLLMLWLILRVLTSLWVAFISPLHPLTALEKAVTLWPPTSPLRQWLARLWLASWERWDTEYYLRIVAQGYRLDDGTAQFHPLYPWLAKPFFWLGDSPLLSLLLVSSLATLGLMFAFSRLAALDLPPIKVQQSLLYFLLFPPAFIFFAPYTESLFLLWSVLCFYWARKQRWWLAGVAGLLATLTRQQGLFLLFPLLWELWEAADRNPKQLWRAWKNWLSLGLIPLGLLGWIVYRAWALGDFNPNWADPQSMIYSIIISPASSQVVPDQAFWWPWQALWFALNHLWQTGELSLIIDLAVMAIFVIYLLLGWPSLRASYRIYSLVIVLVSLAYHTGSFYPYMGLPRHLLLAFPVFIGLGNRLQQRWQQIAVLVMGLMGFIFLMLLYVIEGWVP